MLQQVFYLNNTGLNLAFDGTGLYGIYNEDTNSIDNVGEYYNDDAIVMDSTSAYYNDNSPVTSVPFNTLVENIKKINKIPFNKGEIFWSDDIWDFSSYSTLSINKSGLKLKFENCCEAFKEQCKIYTLFALLENRNKIQTIKQKLMYLVRFLNYANSKGFEFINEIDNYTIDSFCETALTDIKKTDTCIIAIKHFFKFYSTQDSTLWDDGRKQFFDELQEKFPNSNQSQKFEDIPEQWFNNFLNATLVIAKDKNRDIATRATANLYIILSQTGLRIGECLSLEINQIKTVRTVSNKKASFLRYKTWKTGKGNGTYSIGKTYVNELTKEAYDRLVSLYKEQRKKMNTNLLFLGSCDDVSLLPYDTNRFANLMKYFYSALNDYIPIINVKEEDRVPGFSTRASGDIAGRFKGLTFTRPHNHQFRVHACTELYRKGVPFDYIKRFMSHLSSEMTAYYVRPKENIQEDMAYTIDSLEGIVSGELKILGGKGADDVSKRIKDFVDAGNYNVKKDIKTICEDLAKIVPIRQKTGGICIKSSVLRDCSMDAATNELYCAYGVCPNLYHFYYMASVSYRQVKELLETIEINKQNGFVKQVQKEINMLQNIIEHKLSPELEELDVQRKKQGAEKIIDKYPDLEDIIVNLAYIKEEVIKWKLMTA